MIAYGYSRVSGKGQVHGRDGFKRQRIAIEKYCNQNDIPLTELRVYEEKAVPGATDMDDRPSLVELLLDAETEGVKVVIIEALNRLARDLMVQETIIADLRQKGFEVISTQEPDLCSDEPSRILIRQVFGAIAQYEKAMIVLKLRAARMRVRAATGKCEGPKFYGDLNGERPILDLMMDARDGGLTYERIANLMNGNGLRTRGGYEWTPRTIQRIVLRNRAA